ncbi:hypothetical protein ACTXT7_002053 [Hymenolepis weldensis]
MESTNIQMTDCVPIFEKQQAQQQQKHSKTLMEMKFLKDKPRAGYSKKLNYGQLQIAIDENPTCNTRELSNTFYELTESFNGTKAYFKRRGRNEASFKLTKFYEKGIKKLMARWKDVINRNGDYFEH